MIGEQALVASAWKFALLLTLLTAALAHAQTETILYNFGSSATDGNSPYAGLVMDNEGNLYGVAFAGGAYGWGTLFEITTAGVYKTVYNFGQLKQDGRNPWGGLIFDTKGNLYGTTSAGGKGQDYCNSGCGTVYEFATSTGKERVIYRFGGYTGDGLVPKTSLAIDPKGNLYGTTTGGGSETGNDDCSPYDCSTAFVVNSKGKAEEKILYSFNQQVDPNSLTLDATGNLYGTTSEGGDFNQGTAFKLSSKGKFTVLYTFNGETGWVPTSGLIFDNLGNLYGTTWGGGYYQGEGTVYELPAKGGEKVLASFGGDYGVGPGGNLLLDSEGDLYGTAQGDGGVATVFEVTAAGLLNVLYTFGQEGDGNYPNGALVMDTAGNLYGTTQRGGTHNLGTIYKISP